MNGKFSRPAADARVPPGAVDLKTSCVLSTGGRQPMTTGLNAVCSGYETKPCRVPKTKSLSGSGLTGLALLCGKENLSSLRRYKYRRKADWPPVPLRGSGHFYCGQIGDISIAS
jgi:hypothetical protein